MPRYDYQCTICDYRFELVQSFKEAGSGTCPQCSGAGRRVFHAVPVIYKGSGFYTTDYGRPKPPIENGNKENGSKQDSDSKSKAAESGDTAARTESTEPARETSSGSSSTSDSTAAASSAA